MRPHPPSILITAVVTTLVVAPLVAAATALAPGEYALAPGRYVFVVPEGASPSPTSTPTPTPAPTPSPTSTPAPTPSPTATPPSPTPTPTASPTVTPTRTPAPTPTASPGTGPSELRYPRNPLTPGPLPMVETDPAWSDLNDLCCVLDGWAHAVDVDGRTVLQVRHPATGDGHRNAGTPGGKRDPLGLTSCAAFGIRVDDGFPAFAGSDWVVIWQQQQSGPPMVAIEVPSSGTKTHWNIRVRASGGGDVAKVAITPITPGQWEYFVTCFRLADSAGWVRMWHRTGQAPDVSGLPTFERTGLDTFWGLGHETMGLYMSSSTPRRASFSGYGRAATPERAIQLAGLP